jgi:hypothetical protein
MVLFLDLIKCNDSLASIRGLHFLATYVYLIHGIPTRGIAKKYAHNCASEQLN